MCVCVFVCMGVGVCAGVVCEYVGVVCVFCVVFVYVWVCVVCLGVCVSLLCVYVCASLSVWFEL